MQNDNELCSAVCYMLYLFALLFDIIVQLMSKRFENIVNWVNKYGTIVYW